MTITKTITLAEAVAEGYEYFGVDESCSGFQTLTDLTQDNLLEAVASNPDSKIILFEKERQLPSGIDADALREMVEERMTDQYYDECGDDDASDKVETAMKSIDFAPLAAAITAAMNSMTFFHEWSTVEVVPNALPARD